MSEGGFASLRTNLREILRRESPFGEVESSGDSRSASRQLPLILACQGIRFLLFTINAYALTLLVDSEEFGRLLMVGVPIAFVNLFGDLGLGDGVVRTRQMDAALASVFFWANLVIGSAAAAMLMLLLPIFEPWFGVDLLDLTIAFSVVMILGGCVAQYRALLRRQLRLASLSVGEVGVTVAASAGSIAGAVAGLGALSVPLGRGVGLLVDLLILIHLSGWLPGRVSGLSRARPVFAFGWRLALSGVFYFGMAAISNLLLGRFYGPESLGFVERATELSRGFVSRFDQVVRRISYPLIARRTQSDPEGGTRMASRLVKVSIFIWVVPALLLAGIMPSLVSILFGDEWQELGKFLGWAWLGLALWFPLTMATSMLLAHGHSGLLVRINIVMFMVQMAIVAAGLKLGLETYMLLTGFASVVSGCVQLLLMGRRCGADWPGWLRLSALTMASGVMMALVLVSGASRVVSPFAVVMIGGVLMLGWLAIVGWRSSEAKSIFWVIRGGIGRAV